GARARDSAYRAQASGSEVYSTNTTNCLTGICGPRRNKSDRFGWARPRPTPLGRRLTELLQGLIRFIEGEGAQGYRPCVPGTRNACRLRQHCFSVRRLCDDHDVVLALSQVPAVVLDPELLRPLHVLLSTLADA